MACNEEGDILSFLKLIFLHFKTNRNNVEAMNNLMENFRATELFLAVIISISLTAVAIKWESSTGSSAGIYSKEKY